MDVAEPPRIVFENSARCPDGHRAEELLNQVLGHARAPGHAWVVTLRIDAPAPDVLHAEGDITDDGGAAVGHRAFSGKPGGDCRGLARAIGVWASLVLDSEMKRPRTVAAATADPSPPPGHDDGSDAEPSGLPGGKAPSTVVASADGQTSAWPSSPQPGEKPPRREESRALEVGAGGFLMTGTGGGVLLGASPFLLIEVSKGVFLRPALVFGESLPATDSVAVALAATRLDACLRFTGLYTNLHGMQLDVCGGSDVGVLSQQGGGVLPYAAFGPSMDLQGELGGDLAVILRGLVSVNAVEEDTIHMPSWAGRGELAFSWRLR